MSELAGLMRDLRSRDVRLFLEGGQLRFEAPHGAMDATMRARIGERRDELIALLGRAENDLGSIPRADASSWPLSEQQARLWAVDQVQGQGSAHLAFTIDVSGGLDLDRLEAALTALADRHDVMRVRFTRRGEAWRQVLVDQPGVVLRRAVVLPTDPADAAERLVRDEHERAFDLTSEPPVRLLALDRKASDSHTLVVTAHHAAFDAVSIDLLLAELAARYAGQPVAAAAPIRYVDYAAWQQSDAERARVDALADEYATMLRGAPPVHALPLKVRRRGGRNTRGAHWRGTLSAGIMARLEAVARGRGATLFMALEAVFGLLIARYGSQPDVVLGAPTANRQRLETEQLVGCLAGMSPLRVTVEAQDSFSTLLDRVRRFNERVYHMAEVPVASLADRLGLSAEASHHPIYQITIGLQPSGRAVVLDGRACVAEPRAAVTSQVDLGLDIMPAADGWVQRWEYQSDLFDEATVRRMATHFATLIERVAAEPDALLALIAHVDASDDGAATPRSHRDDAPRDLASAFLRVADAHPDVTALVVDETRLSFAELRREAERCAARFASLGARPGDAIGLSVEKDRHTFIAMLGVLMLGAAYVPIDPDDPPERHEQICRQAGVAFVTGGSRLADTWADPWTAFVPSAPTALATQPPPAVPHDAGRLPAYVMFSSGSAGRPKAITVIQAAVARLAAAEDWLRFAPGELGLAAATLSFDASVYELWVPWLQGAGVVIVGRETLLEPAALEALLRRETVAAAFFTTALFNRLSEDAPALFGRLRRVLFGGEHVTNNAVAAAVAAAPGTTFVHVYGPTENTVFSTGHVIAPTDVVAHEPVPIGAALATDRAVVVGRDGLRVGVAGVGELLLGGPGLAIGYAGEPRLTALAFVPDHLGGPPGARLYRTGDRVRRRTEREVTFVGRTDRQVKISGFRIELDEVEEHLRALDQVADAVAVARTGTGGGDGLVAFVTLKAGGFATGAALRAATAGRMPGYMRPAAIAVLETMPLTRNGKIDAAALPAIRLADDGEDDGAAPVGDAERMVAAIWADAIGAPVERTDRDFFEAGGTSLAAMAACQALRRRHGVELALADFLLQPTIGLMAARLAAANEADAALVEIEL